MSPPVPKLCVCILFYGADDYCCQLARRVLNGPMRELATDCEIEFRFGLNAVGENVKAIVVDALNTDFFNRTTVFESDVNVYKYPIMRRMFYEKQLQAPLTMWFDDNSFINPTTDVFFWLDRVVKQMQHCSMIGSVYTQGLAGNQADWVRAQHWFNGKVPGPYVKYAAGGWWTVDTAILHKFDWPSHDIKHYGGDVMLGELLCQQNLRLCHFRDNVTIQGNANGVESVATRRGFDAPPVGFDYEKPNAH